MVYALTSELLALVHADLAVIPVRTPSGFPYFVAFHDDASAFHAVYPLRQKSDAFDAFVRFKTWAEKQTGQHLKVLQDDKGGEFVGARWDTYFSLHGIEHRRTARNRPEQNGVAERANRTLVEGINGLCLG